MKNKKIKIGLLMVFLMTLPGLSKGFDIQKSELSKSVEKIVGDYQIPYPHGLKNMLYIRYFVKGGKFYQKQVGIQERYELFPEGDSGLLYKSPEDGFTHRFLTTQEGKVYKVQAESKSVKLEGLKMAPVKKIQIGDTFSVEALLADFDQMLDIIRYLHPSLYDYTSKKEFDRAVNSARAKLNKPLSINGFYKIIAPIVASIGCAHSYLRLPEKYRTAKANTYFPFAVHMIKDKLFITKSIDPAYSHLEGKVVRFINGKSAGRLTREVLETLSADWKNPRFKTYLFNRSFTYYFNYMYGNMDHFQIEYQEVGKKEKNTISLRGVSREQMNNFFAGEADHPIYNDKPYSLTFLKDNRIAVLHISHFEFYQKKKEAEFKKFIDTSFSEIKKRNIQNLLLDIRGNGGGAPPASQYLLSYLIDKPFQYFNKFHKEGGGAYQKLFDLQNPNPKFFTGNLITLIDNGCLSTSGHFIALLKYHQAGKLAGLETGTTFTCTDGSTVKYLLNTGIWFKIARDRFTTAVQGFKPNEGIKPDYQIDLTLIDLLDDRDYQLEKTLELFKKK